MAIPLGISLNRIGREAVAVTQAPTRWRHSAGYWTVAIVPPQGPLPEIGFADNVDTLDARATEAVAASIWAARRWNIGALGVPGLPKGSAPAKPNLTRRRALAIAEQLRRAGLVASAAPPAGQRFALVPASVLP